MEARQYDYQNINLLSQVHTSLLYFSQQKTTTKCALAIASNLKRSLEFMKRFMEIGLKYSEKDAEGKPRYYLLSFDDKGEALYLPYDKDNPQKLPPAVKIEESDEYHAEMGALNKDIDFRLYTVLDGLELVAAPVTAAYMIPLIQAGLLNNLDTSVIDKRLNINREMRNGELVN